jgi:hypothetical protein
MDYRDGTAIRVFYENPGFYNYTRDILSQIHKIDRNLSCNVNSLAKLAFLLLLCIIKIMYHDAHMSIMMNNALYWQHYPLYPLNAQGF